MSNYGLIKSLSPRSDRVSTPTSPDHLSFLPSPSRPIRKQNSVILARSGAKVHRLDSFLESGFVSLNDPPEEIDDVNSVITERLTLLNAASLNETVGVRVKGVIEEITSFISLVYMNETYRAVLKCLLAYLVASLGVYWTKFDDILGNTDSKHVVATVAVYFHPARTKGSMHQTILFVVVSLLFSFLISVMCRSLSTYFFIMGEDEISYTIDLFISSIGLGFIAFMKQKVNKATFNTACSLASISVVTCIVKEGSLNSAEIPFRRLVSTAYVVVVGSLISVAICYIVWPQSAVIQLKNTLNDSYNIMSLSLSLLANRFLAGEKLSSKDTDLLNSLKKNITRLKTNLDEAYYELKLLGKEVELNSFVLLVETTIVLSTHIQALHSSTEMQWQLLHNQETQSSSDDSSLASYRSEILRLSESVENMQHIKSYEEESINIDAVSSSELFELFVHYLSPSIKSYIFTIKGVLSEVPFENSHRDDQDVLSSTKFTQSANFRESLVSAIDLFRNKQVESFGKLYSQEVFSSSHFELKADQEEVTACCGNFSSILVLFGEELITFLKLAENHEASENSPRTWSWLKFSKNEQKHPQTHVDVSLNEALINLQSQYRSYPRAGSRAEPKRFELYSFKLWKALKGLRRTDVQFGIRVGLGAFFISLFAFHPRTKETFNNWRGEWALVIYCIMMNKSLGGTTMTVKWRFIGTFSGAGTAYLIWILTDGNVYALALTGFVLSIPCFYIIIYWNMNNAFGRFILLTYNLTALYSYGMTQKDSEDGNEGGENPIVGEIAFHRFVAVSAGIMSALIMASCFLPNSARARLKTGLTLLWLRMGVIWNSNPLDYATRFNTQGREETRLVGMKDEKGINDLLAECETLLKQAPLEFRIKGSFPKSIYADLISKTYSIIIAFQNMNLMIDVDPVLNANEKYVIDYISEERSEVEHRIFLMFYMIASAMKLGFPLPSKPASTEHAKDRLLFKLNEFRSSSQSSLANEDYVLLYSYILVTSTINNMLDEIIELIKELFGDISEDTFQLV